MCELGCKGLSDAVCCADCEAGDKFLGCGENGVRLIAMRRMATARQGKHS